MDGTKFFFINSTRNKKSKNNASLERSAGNDQYTKALVNDLDLEFRNTPPMKYGSHGC
jgi:hypothetical protein